MTKLLKLIRSIHQGQATSWGRKHLNKVKRIEIICVCLDHNGIKLEITNRKIARKFPTIWKSHNTLLNNTRAKELLRTIKKYLN